MGTLASPFQISVSIRPETHAMLATSGGRCRASATKPVAQASSRSARLFACSLASDCPTSRQVIGGLLGRTSLGLFFQIIFNKTQFQSVKSPFAQFRCRRTANAASICALATATSRG